MPKPSQHPDRSCPCTSGRRHRDCCAPLHAGAAAPTAEALMRSRYSAYVERRGDYLLSTWHPDTRPGPLDFSGDRTQWLGLEVKRHVVTGDDAAEVEFVARWREGGQSARRLHETSRFQRIDGRWYYVDGEIHAR